MQTQFLAATKMQFAMREGSIVKRYQFYEKVIRRCQQTRSFFSLSIREEKEI